MLLAGVAVVVEGDDSELRSALVTALHGAPARSDPAGPAGTATIGTATVAMVSEPRTIPATQPDDVDHETGVRFWTRADRGPVASREGVTVDVDLDRCSATIAGFDAGRHSFVSLAALAWIGVAWLMATHDRYAVHAAAVGRDADALLLLGHSGAGKSTAVFAALEAGWWALGDDSIVVEPTDDGGFAHGVHRPPAAPLEIGGSLLASSARIDDSRRRGRLGPEVLSARRARIVGVVVADHSDQPGGVCTRIPGHEAMPLLVQSCGPASDPRFRRPFFRVAGDLARLPVWSLGHAAEPERRRAAAAGFLDRCLREAEADRSAGVTDAG